MMGNKELDTTNMTPLTPEQDTVNIDAIFNSQGGDLATISKNKAILNEKYIKALERINQLEDHIEKQDELIKAYENKEKVKDTAEK